MKLSSSLAPSLPHNCMRQALILLLLLACLGCSNHARQASIQSASLPIYRVYLAGPEVFLPEPVAAGEHKKALIERLNKSQNWPFRLQGLYPMDNEIPDFAPNYTTGLAIYAANIELMDRADFITANMVRFRGPSMDVGTAFEMGYMAGLAKPVFAYYDAEPFYGSRETPGMYKDRVLKHYPVVDSGATDVHGQSIEDFQMADNLMMIGALQTGAGTIAYSFEAAILQIAEHILSQQR